MLLTSAGKRPLLRGGAMLRQLSFWQATGRITTVNHSSRPFVSLREAGGAGRRSGSRSGSCSGRRGLTTLCAQQQLQPAVAPAEEPQAEVPHISVLLNEVLGFFEGLSVACYVDGTLGAAGHASEVLKRHPELRCLVGFDLDTSAHAIATARLEEAGARVVPVTPQQGPGGRLAGLALEAPSSSHGSGQSSPPSAYIVHSNFGGMGPVLSQLQGGALMGAVDAALLDLGMSSMQVDEADRGFSFLRDGPLDMRMDASAHSVTRSAEELLNTASEVELGRIFRDFGEERFWKSIARRVVCAREEAPITTTQQLVKVIGNPGGGGGRGRRGDAKQKHPATRVFQALRIAVNDELRSIATALPDAIESLRPGGRLAVITFHSLEDRIVKWAFRRAAGMAPSDEGLPSYCIPFDHPLDQPVVKILTRRPVIPSEEEQAANSRSRSAKLRVVERL